MRIFVALALVIGFQQSASAAGAHLALNASSVASLNARSFSLEAIRIAKFPVSQSKVETCDAGDNPQICVNSGATKSVVEVSVAYVDADGETLSQALHLPVSAFSTAQLSAIAAGAAPGSIVKLEIGTYVRNVNVPSYGDCVSDDLAGAMHCSGPVTYRATPVKFVDLHVVVR